MNVPRQPELWAPPTVPLARNSDGPTAKAAARAQTPRKLATGRWLVLNALAEFGPSTDHELSARTGLVLSSAGKRRGDLMRLGWVRGTEDRRPSPTGTPARVWELTGEGRVVHSEHAVRRATEEPDAS